MVRTERLVVNRAAAALIALSVALALIFSSAARGAEPGQKAHSSDCWDECGVVWEEFLVRTQRADCFPGASFEVRTYTVDEQGIPLERSEDDYSWVRFRLDGRYITTRRRYFRMCVHPGLGKHTVSVRIAWKFPGVNETEVLRKSFLSTRFTG